MIRVSIVGANGKMGTQIAKTISDSADFELALTIDKDDDINSITPQNTDIVFEITVAGVSADNVAVLLNNGNNRIVVGTSGWSEADISKLQESLGNGSNNASNGGVLNDNYAPRVLIVPNFSISAILQELWTIQAAKHFNDIHIFETHHKAKVDSPSGTALRLQSAVLGATDNLTPEISSARQDGFMANQRVVLTNFGERLTIEQDITSREAFMPGVLFALKAINSYDFKCGVTVGLGELL